MDNHPNEKPLKSLYLSNGSTDCNKTWHSHTHRPNELYCAGSYNMFLYNNRNNLIYNTQCLGNLELGVLYVFNFMVLFPDIFKVVKLAIQVGLIKLNTVSLWSLTVDADVTSVCPRQLNDAHGSNMTVAQRTAVVPHHPPSTASHLCTHVKPTSAFSPPQSVNKYCMKIIIPRECVGKSV